MNEATKNRLLFLARIKQTYPALYAAALHRHGLQNSGLGGLGDTATGTTAPTLDVTVGGSSASTTDPAQQSWWQNTLSTITNTIQQLAPAYVASQQANACISINSERAKNGLAPIDCASSGLAPQVSVGVSPGVQQLSYVGIGAVVLIGVLIAFAVARRH